MTCALESRIDSELNPLCCCWPGRPHVGLSPAGVYDITWAGLQWRIPLCQYHADEQAAGAPVLELEDFSRLRAIGRCWGDERALGLLVCWCPSHGIHRATLARLEQMARPQIFPQDEEERT